MRAKSRRRGKPAPRKRKRRLGSFLFLVGILAVLGVTFAAGAVTGRFSLRPAAVANAKTVDRTPKPPPVRTPELTFYRELTAPLTPSPLPPKPAAKPAQKSVPAPPPAAAEPVKRADGAEAPPQLLASADISAAPPSPIAPPRGDGVRYTVQVGSYNVRAQAEAMRARLAVAGHEAYISEGEAGGVMRYRVRIGVYPTAEEARQAAVQLASQAQVATYVTTR